MEKLTKVMKNGKLYRILLNVSGYCIIQDLVTNAIEFADEKELNFKEGVNENDWHHHQRGCKQTTDR